MRLPAGERSWRLLKSGVAQAGGKLVLSLIRLVIAIIILRLAGVERFGEYALVLQLLIICEWLADFGLSDIAVRDICRWPQRQASLLRALAQIKIVQPLLAYLLLWLMLLALDYPQPVVRAALVGGLGLFCYASALVYRAYFKVHLRLEQDVLGEIVGVLATIPLVIAVCLLELGLVGLAACYAVSRAVFLVWVIIGARKQVHVLAGRAGGGDLRGLVRGALPLGLAGLLVCLCDSTAPMLLAKLADMTAVAHFTGAARFVFLILIVVQAVTAVFFPVLSSYWRQDAAAFAKTQQQVLELGLLAAAVMFCALHASAGFLMILLSPEMIDAATTLKLMSWVVLARTVTTLMTPLVIVAGVHARALWLTVLSLTLQVIAMLWLVPVYGINGAVVGYLIIELAVGVVPMSVIGQRVTGTSIRWRTPVMTLLTAVISVSTAEWIGDDTSALNGVFAVALFLGLAWGGGVISRPMLSSVITTVRERSPSGGRGRLSTYPETFVNRTPAWANAHPEPGKSDRQGD